MSIESLIALFRENANEDQAIPMNAYMKNNFIHLGIKTPLRRELLKTFLKENPLEKEWISILWELPEREYQIAAVDMLALIRKKLTAEDLPLVERLITTKSWWDTVDALAAHIAGEIFRKDEAARRDYVMQWNESDNMWLNRTAILHQLTYKTRTDEDLLYRCVLRHAESNEFFHQKAIGWALRTYAKVNPGSVLEFVESHKLKPLSRREALKHF
jgi:3-methyladenine DNA glycosylase AlkD